VKFGTPIDVRSQASDIPGESALNVGPGTSGRPYTPSGPAEGAPPGHPGPGPERSQYGTEIEANIAKGPRPYVRRRKPGRFTACLAGAQGWNGNALSPRAHAEQQAAFGDVAARRALGKE